jgi:RNA polymerase sigma-70 factor (ECF subfamily)
MTAEEIEGIIERVRGGDRAAYAAVVREYQHEIWRVAAYALRGRSETEDLVQQAFVVAYHRLDRYERGRDFGAWLRGIARNLVRDRVKAQARESRRMQRYLTHLEGSATTDGEADARETSLRRALSDCREKLSSQAREALALRYDEGLDFAGVARAMGRTVAAARQLLQRTRLDLRHCIEGKLA